MLLLGAVVMAAFAGLALWYTIGNHFAEGGALSDSGWVSSGNGILFLFLTSLLFATSALTFGLSFKEVWKAAVAMAIVLVIYAVCVHFMVDAAAKDNASSNLIWFILSFFVIAGFAGWGFYSLWSAHSKSFTDPKTNAGVKSHYMFALGSGGATVVLLIVYLAMWYKLYSDIHVTTA
jgi:hypothetical protein